jgi:gamma-glutamyltranspeptidase/glutathione hydrolase
MNESMFTTRPELKGNFGMVASTHWLASATGMSVLEDGGNAFDAAVAAGFVLQVVEPHLNGPGGEVPIILYSARRDEVVVVDGQGVAPGAASIDRFRDVGLDLVPGTGLLAACVPGAFSAWMLMLGEFGTMRPADVLSHAIGYAENGYPVLPAIEAAVSGVEDLFRTEWIDSAPFYLDGSAPPRAGARWRNTVLAQTYRRIVEESEAAGTDRDAQIEAALRAFYEGFVAEAIDDYVGRNEILDSSGRRNRGLLNGADMAAWRAGLEAPVTLDYAGYTVCKTGPWGQGPVFLQQLALLAGFDLGSMPPGGVDFIHTVVECAKLAFADREAWYGDPKFVDVPLAALLDAGYNDRRRSLVSDVASLELRPGTVEERTPVLPDLFLERASAGTAGSGEPTMAGDMPGDTCHVDVVDRFGNIVSATPSGGWLQSSPVIPSLGFPLGTRAQMFWLTDGVPNALAGGKRPRTTLSPSLALRNGEPYLAFGTPGGDQQDQWSLIFFLHHVHGRLDLQAAIDAPMWNSSHFPSSFYPRDTHLGEVHVEERVDPRVVDKLRARGHRVVVEPEWSLGRVSAAGRDREGWLKAAANPRGMQGYAVGR